MNIKASIALTALVLSAALSTPVFAQSGTITFKGRIVAPICSGTAVAGPAQANQQPAFSMDNSGCEHSAGLVASTRMSSDVAPTQSLIRAQPNGTGQTAAAEPVVTITYH